MFENKKPKLNFYLFNLGFYWQRGQDSNLREIALKLISSQPRYDHFDTSPYNFCFWGAVCKMRELFMDIVFKKILDFYKNNNLHSTF